MELRQSWAASWRCRDEPCFLIRRADFKVGFAKLCARQDPRDGMNTQDEHVCSPVLDIRRRLNDNFCPKTNPDSSYVTEQWLEFTNTHTKINLSKGKVPADLLGVKFRFYSHSEHQYHSWDGCLICFLIIHWGKLAYLLAAIPSVL